jgi:hypothetical protein
MPRRRRRPLSEIGEASKRISATKRYGCTPPPVRTLADMTKAEIRRLERDLGAKVIKPT